MCTTVPAGERSVTGTNGFTMPELIVALGLLGVALALGLSNLDWWAWRLNTAAAQVARQIGVARSLAVLRQHDVIVEFDFEGRTIVVHEDRNNDGVRDADERVVRQGLEGGVAFDRGGAPAYAEYTATAVTFDEARVTLRRNGSASAEGAVYLGRPGADAGARVVVIARATGYTQTLRYNGSRWIADDE